MRLSGYSIWDGEGIDIIDASSYVDSVQIDLRQGHFSSIGKNGNSSDAVTFDSGSTDAGNVAISFYTVIENAIGTDEDDSLIGNAWDNILSGGAGDDVIYGDGYSYAGVAEFTGDDDTDRPGSSSAVDGSGDDILIGGSGADTFYGGKGDDIIHGGFNADEISAMRPGWDVGEQFSEVEEFNGTGDTIDYSSLSSGMHLTFEEGDLTVEKGEEGIDGTDHLLSVQNIVGTSTADIFEGGDGSIDYYGGGGFDRYIFDIGGGDFGAGINDTLSIGTLELNNTSGYYLSVPMLLSGQFDFYDTSSLENMVASINASTVEAILINGETIYTRDLLYNMGLFIYGANVSSAIAPEDIYPTIFNSDSGYSGGIKPSIDGYGNITSVRTGGVSSIMHYPAYFFAEENLHPLLITSLSSGGGTAEASMETYVKSIDFLGDVTASDIRLTASNDLNEASLTIYFGGESFTIEDFENGRTINPVGLYDMAFHTQVEGATTAELTQTALGDFTGDYSYSGSFTYTASTTPVTYFLETLHFTTGSDIDLQASTLTFKGTASADTLYGLNTRGDIIQGDAGSDTLYGYGGNDQLNGGEGADTLYGGLGDDTYSVDDAGDIVVESASEGTDSVYATVSIAALADNVENLFFNIGGVGNLNGTGNALSNIIVGNNSDNILDGGAGNDYLSGYGGNDTFIVDSYSDVIYETTGADTVHITIPSYSGYYTAPTNVENLTLASGILMNMYGNSLDNVIMGNETNNKMNGWDGADTLMGGAGNDTYYIYDSYDSVVEYDGEGNDFVYAKVSYTLDNYVENLVIYDTTNINGTGNSMNNTLTGGAGNNSLYGMGGNDTLDGAGGTDALYGGAGDDTYIVDTTTDTITEYSAEGSDTIQSSVTYTIASLANVENITLTGSSNINATGNSGNNILKGNTGTNVLVGGAGDDTYYVGSGDTITESSGEGTDTVYIGISGGTYTLAANVENAVVMDGYILNVSGNSLDNIIIGNSTNNKLNGKGGADTLQGGSGNDTFVLEDSYISSVDTIVDLNLGQGDKLDLRDLLSAYDPLTDILTDFVEITTSGSDSIVKVDMDGTGSTYGLTHVATIQGLTGLTDEAALVSSGNLLVS